MYRHAPFHLLPTPSHSFQHGTDTEKQGGDLRQLAATLHKNAARRFLRPHTPHQFQQLSRHLLPTYRLTDRGLRCQYALRHCAGHHHDQLRDGLPQCCTHHGPPVEH